MGEALNADGPTQLAPIAPDDRPGSGPRVTNAALPTNCETPPVDALPALFKQAMRRLASTVCVLTCRDEAGAPFGMSATAVTSLTADPPTMLMCVNRAGSMHAALRPGRPVCVQLLAERHEELCFAFGGRVAGAERFAVGTWDLDGGLPWLTDAQANLFCIIEAMHAHGTHSIVVAKVETVRLHGDFAPLVFGDGRPMRAVGTAAR